MGRLDRVCTKNAVYIFLLLLLNIMLRNTQTRYKQTCSCTQIFALCENRTRDLLRSRRVFLPVRQPNYRQLLANMLLYSVGYRLLFVGL
jgi:hypothetical protein